MAFSLTEPEYEYFIQCFPNRKEPIDVLQLICSKKKMWVFHFHPCTWKPQNQMGLFSSKVHWPKWIVAQTFWLPGMAEKLQLCPFNRSQDSKHIKKFRWSSNRIDGLIMLHTVVRADCPPDGAILTISPAQLNRSQLLCGVGRLLLICALA